MTSAEERRQAINGLRGWAAIIVILQHFTSDRDTRFISPILKSLCLNGNFAVSLFFCISGMIVFESFGRRTSIEAKPQLNFAIRRFFRIFPLYWFLLGLLFIFRGLSWETTWRSAFFLFTINGYDPNTMPIYPAWSLPVEELFYLVLPYAFKKLCSIASCIQAIFIFFVLALLWNHFATSWFWVPADRVIRYPFAHIHFFLIGVLISNLYRDSFVMRWFNNVSQSQLDRLGETGWVDFIALTFFMATAMRISIPYEISVTLFLLAALQSGTLINKFFRSPILCACGEVCYSIYLTHHLLIGNLFKIEEQLMHRLTVPSECFGLRLLVCLPLLTFLVWILGKATAVLIEKPFQALGEKLIKLWEEDTIPVTDVPAEETKVGAPVPFASARPV